MVKYVKANSAPPWCTSPPPRTFGTSKCIDHEYVHKSARIISSYFAKLLLQWNERFHDCLPYFEIKSCFVSRSQKDNECSPTNDHFRETASFLRNKRNKQVPSNMPNGKTSNLVACETMFHVIRQDLVNTIPILYR